MGLRTWFDTDIEFLSSNWDTMTDREIGGHLGKSIKAIANRRKQLGLKKSAGIRKEETGNIYGKLTVLGPSHVEKQPNGSYWYWNCKCECGNIVTVHGGSLRKGHTKSCGCLKYRKWTDAEITILKALTPIPYVPLREIKDILGVAYSRMQEKIEELDIQRPPKPLHCTLCHEILCDLNKSTSAARCITCDRVESKLQQRIRRSKMTETQKIKGFSRLYGFTLEEGATFFEAKATWYIANHARRHPTKPRSDLNAKYLKKLWHEQDGICALSQYTPFPYKLKINESIDRLKPSLDQIDAGEGYYQGNVQWTTRMLNIARQGDDIEIWENAVKVWIGDPSMDIEGPHP